MTHVTDDPDAAPPRRPRRRVELAVLGFLALAGLVVWGLLPASLAPFHGKVAELRAAGYATSHDEHVGRAPPDEINAAPELLAAWADLEAKEGPQASWTVTGPWDAAALDPWFETASPERLAELAGFLDRIQPFFDRVDTALERPRMWFDEPPDDMGSRLRKGVPLSQNLQRVLHARAEAGRSPAGRLAACSTQVRFAARFELSNLVDGMVAGAIQGSGLASLRRLVDAGLVPAAEARSAAEPLLRRPFAASHPRMCRGQIASRAEWYGRVLGGEIDFDALSARLSHEVGAPSRPVLGGLWETSLGPGEFADLLEFGRVLAETDPSDPVRWLERLAAIAADVPDWAAPELRGAPRYAERLVRLDAVAAVTRVGLAAAEFRETHGNWPEALDDLRASFPGGIPLDPFTGRPLRFERTILGVFIASRGAVPEKPPPTEIDLEHDLLAWDLREE